MADRWLLIETFGGEGHEEPTVIGVGRVVKRMVPLDSVLGRGRYLEDFRALVARVADSGEPVRAMSRDGRRQMIGDPLRVFTGRVHGVYAWMGDPGEEPPPRDPAGAWYFNLTRDTTVRSDDLLDLYGVAPEDRQSERRIAEMFARLVTNSDEAAGLAVMVRSRPGDEHQATWGIRRTDGQLRAGNFACRVIAEPAGEGGQTEILIRGITHDIGAAEETPSAPPRMVLAQQVIAAEAVAGRHRAIINLRRLILMRWVDDPMPGVAWQLDDAEHPPAIHPDDLPAAKQMSDGLATGARVEGILRVRSVTGGWMPLAVVANLIILDQHTTAALVTVSDPQRPPA
jgi:Domain of unknown function (DUF5593)